MKFLQLSCRSGIRKKKNSDIFATFLLNQVFSLPALLIMILALLLNSQANASERKPGDEFQDCNACPQMVVIPAGNFDMGDLIGNGHPKERPVHSVNFDKHFAVGKYEITFEEWDACIAAGGCSHRPKDNNMGREKRPVDWVSWGDAKIYVNWISAQTGNNYRLLTEAEWEYVSRAGTRTNFTWGNNLGSGNANCAYCDIKGLPQMIPVGSFPANPFGVHDMVGSVNEWIEDCGHRNYQGAPQDGSAWIESGSCERRGVRGGSIYETEKFQLPSVRSFRSTEERINQLGFRVALTL